MGTDADRSEEELFAKYIVLRAFIRCHVARMFRIPPRQQGDAPLPPGPPVQRHSPCWLESFIFPEIGHVTNRVFPEAVLP